MLPRAPARRGRIGSVCDREMASSRCIPYPAPKASSVWRPSVTQTASERLSYPVDCAKEGDDDGAVAELDRLQDMKPLVCCFMADHDAIQDGGGCWPLGPQVPSEIERRHRRRHVRQRAGQA